jgi:hypothetical protein
LAVEVSGRPALQPMQNTVAKSAKRSPIVTTLSLALNGNVGN